MAKRCVVVTGAESGIGAACAVAFGEARDKVAVFYHSDERAAAKVAKQVEKAGGNAMTRACSVDDEASVESSIAESVPSASVPSATDSTIGSALASTFLSSFAPDGDSR